jgi:hypothetical protein
MADDATGTAVVLVLIPGASIIGVLFAIWMWKR